MGSEEALRAIAAKVEAAENEIEALFRKAQTALSKMDDQPERSRPDTTPLRAQLTEAQRRLDEKKLVIIFAGATSSGKSTLINTLIRKRLLRATTQHCTPCSVSIETLPDISEPFFTKGRFSQDSEKFDISKLADTTDAQHSSHSREPVFVFLPRENDNNVFKIEKIRLVDTPGVFESSFQNNADLEGDAFVFLVDFDSDSSWRKLTKIFTKSTEHLDKAVFIVFNACDKEQDPERFEEGRRGKLERATAFLLENKVYPSEEAASKAVFFLSARTAETQRRHDASLCGLRAAICRIVNSKNRKPHEFDKIVVCGNSDAGKTTLCNDLVGLEVFPADETETPCFMSVQGTRSRQIPTAQYLKEKLSREPMEVSSLAETILSFADERQNDINASHIVEIVVPESQLPLGSILHSKVAVVDSAPHEEVVRHGSIANTKCPTPSVLAVVVRGDANMKQMKREIESSLRFYRISKSPEVEVFLIVIRWRDLRQKREGCAEETESKIRRTTEEICQRLELATPQVYFLEREGRMGEYGGAFDDFEAQLLEAAHDKFAETKLNRIEASAQKLRADIDTTLQREITRLQEMKQAFHQLTDTLQIQDETLVTKRSTRAERFLKTKPDLPDDDSQMEKFFDDFLIFYQDDLTKDIEHLIQKALQNLDLVDDKSREETKTFLEDKVEVFKSDLGWKSENNVLDGFSLKETRAKFLKFIPSAEHETTEIKINEMKILLANLQNVLLPLLDEQITLTELDISRLEEEKRKKVDELNERSEFIGQKKKEEQDLRERIQNIDQAIDQKTKDLEALERSVAEKCKEIDEKQKELKLFPFLFCTQRTICLPSLMECYNLFKFTRSLRNAVTASKEDVEEMNQNKDLYGAEADESQHQKEDETGKFNKIQIDIQTAIQERNNREKEIITCSTETSKLTSNRDEKTIERDDAMAKVKRIQESLPGMKEKFLQQKNDWKEMTKKYFVNLLTGLEKMSDMLLDRILQQLCDAVQNHTCYKTTVLDDEKELLEAIRTQLMDAS